MTQGPAIRKHLYVVKHGYRAVVKRYRGGHSEQILEAE